MVGLIIDGIQAFNVLVLVYFGLINVMYGAMAILSVRSLRRYVPGLDVFDPLDRSLISAAPPITLLVPAHNEEANCVDSTRSLLALDYPDFEILVINDGSTDQTLPRLKEAFDLIEGVRAPTAKIPTAGVRAIYRSRLHPNLWVVDKANGGKADALNAGINHCVTPLFCAIDADSLLERDALMRIVRPFLEDGSTVAAGGIIRVVNDCSVVSGVVDQVRLPGRILARIQVLEYLRAFLVGRVGWAAIDASLVISGAFGLFSRSTVADAGGYASARTSGETVGEDMELVVRLKRHCHEHRLPCRVAFVPDAVAWTEVPEDLGTLGRQRDRWQRGLFQSLTRHRQLLFNPSYGATGLLAFPHFFLLEMLGPVLEALGYLVLAVSIVLGVVSNEFLVLFFLLSVALGGLVSLVAVSLEEFAFHRYRGRRDVAELFFLAAIENLGFRQLTVWWRVRGLLKLLRRDAGWGAMRRRGFEVGDAPRAGVSAGSAPLGRRQASLPG